MLGKTELARIHILKKEAALTDDEYRSLLFGAAGVNSASDIETPDQYYKVIFTLEKYLVSIGKPPSRRPAGTPWSLPEVIRERSKRILGHGYQNRMAGYLRKMGKSNLDDCSDSELRRVMAFLSAVEKDGTKSQTRKPKNKNRFNRHEEGT
jgi:hypothetical protein